MAQINSGQVRSENESQPTTIIIPMLTAPPQLGVTLDTPVTPNQIRGWYNGSSDMVELYISSAGGTSWVRVTSTNIP